MRILSGFLLVLVSILSVQHPYTFDDFEITDYYSESISEGIQFERFNFISSNNQNALFHATLDPNNDNVKIVLHDVYPDSDTFSSGTVTNVALDYEAKTGEKVYAAVNGDFFWNHAPIDYYIKDYAVLQEGYHDEKEAFGFNNFGDYALGTPILNDILIAGDNHFNVDRFGGTPPYPGEIAIYLPGQTMHTIETSKYLVKANQTTLDNDFNLPLEGNIIIEDTSYMSDESLEVTKGYFGISVNGMAGYLDKVDAFHESVKHFDDIRFLRGPVGDFEGLNYVIGGNNIMLEEGLLMPEPLKTSSAADSWQPRTAIGINEDGEFFIAVVDGRNPGTSSGLTIPVFGQFLKDLGGYSALELDGGGSSTFVLRQNDQLTVVNNPSDGIERRVTNAVLFVENSNAATDDEQDDQNNGSNQPPVDEDINHTEEESEPYGVILFFSASVLLIMASVIILVKKRL